MTPEERAQKIDLGCTGDDVHGPGLDGDCNFCREVRKQIVEQIKEATRNAVIESPVFGDKAPYPDGD